MKILSILFILIGISALFYIFKFKESPNNLVDLVEEDGTLTLYVRFLIGGIFSIISGIVFLTIL
ncbi:MAG: hypothetical protein RIQ33_666 [Bacteroidota bacterium]|jgi:hypothetical protein